MSSAIQRKVNYCRTLGYCKIWENKTLINESKLFSNVVMEKFCVMLWSHAISDIWTGTKVSVQHECEIKGAF